MALHDDALGTLDHRGALQRLLVLVGGQHAQLVCRSLCHRAVHGLPRSSWREATIRVELAPQQPGALWAGWRRARDPGPLTHPRNEQRKTRARGDRELFIRSLREGEPGARDQLVERFLPLARQLARRYQRANEPLDDLIQVASIGLVKAVDRFDLDRGVAFSSYAVPTILGELKRYFRDSGWAVHVPRGIQERAMQVDRAIKELAGRLGRSPSVDEVAQHMHGSVEDVLGAMEAGQAYEAVSLDSERGKAGEPGAETVADGIGE